MLLYLQSKYEPAVTLAHDLKITTQHEQRRLPYHMSGVSSN